MTGSAVSFDALDVGTEWQTGARTVEAALIEAFASLSGDRTPIHTDRESARLAGYPDLVAHGTLVIALATGLLCQVGNLTASALATRGLDWQFSRPVLAGSTVRCRARVMSKRAVSDSAGLVDLRVELLDTSGRRLQHGTLRLLLRRATPAERSTHAAADA